MSVSLEWPHKVPAKTLRTWKRFFTLTSITVMWFAKVKLGSKLMPSTFGAQSTESLIWPRWRIGPCLFTSWGLDVNRVMVVLEEERVSPPPCHDDSDGRGRHDDGADNGGGG